MAAAAIGCGTAPCSFNSECAAGSFCDMGTCRSECSASLPCPTGEVCTSFGECVASDAGSQPPDAGTDAGHDAGHDEADAGQDAGMDAATDAGPPPESCAPSSGSAIDEDGDGAIDEGCPWHFGVPHPVVAAHVRAGVHWFPTLSADGRRLYFGAPNEAGQHVPYVAERADRASPFGAPVPVPGTWGTGPVYTISLRGDELEAFVQTTAGTTAQHVYRAIRTSRTAAFGPLERVESAIVGASESVHPWISQDGLELIFRAYGASEVSLYRTRRPDLTSEFGPAERLTIEGTASAGDPESPRLGDARTMFFARFDGSTYTPFVATRASDEASFGDVVELTALGSAVAPTYLPATRELFFNAPPGTEWAPTEWSMWRVEVCRDGPCTAREVTCDAPGIRSADGLHCYLPGVTSGGGATTDWAESVASCAEVAVSADERAYLASIHSQAELDLVATMIPRMPWIWTGAYDDMMGLAECHTDKTCPWGWISGEPWTFSPWSPTEPSDLDPLEDCMLLWDVPGFGDAWCGSTQAFACERELWPTW